MKKSMWEVILNMKSYEGGVQIHEKVEAEEPKSAKSQAILSSLLFLNRAKKELGHTEMFDIDEFEVVSVKKIRR
jgi:hypothetical protein